MPFDWDKFRGDRWKPSTKGDYIKGTIDRITTATFSNGPAPVLHIDVEVMSMAGRESRPTGITEVIASQTVLVQRLAELGPQHGDYIEVVFTGEAEQSMPGRSPAKLFDVALGQRPPSGGAAPAADEEPF